MGLDTWSYDEALLGGNVVHNELLEHTSIDIANVLLESVARHAEGIETVGSPEQELLILAVGVVLV